MKSPFLFLFIVLLTPLASIANFPVTAAEQEWIECIPSSRFEPLNQISKHYKQAVPYYKARGVYDEESIEKFVCEDISHIAHAFSVLFEQDQKRILRNFLGEYFFLIEGYNAQIDHIGRELYGPLSFYLPMLNEIALNLGLIHLGDLVFPSTQVVKTLREQDPSLQGVTIGRAYFQSIESGQIGCLELFQASPQNEKNPQHIEATQKRLSLLTNSTKNSTSSPIDHISIEVNSVEEVQNIHEHIHKLESVTLQPNQKEVCYNPGDRSTQTKVLIRNSKEAPFSKIIEFVHYAK